MKNAIEGVAAFLDRVTKVLVVVLLGALVAVISIEVLFRYVLRIPAVWSEQLATYVMIWIAYLSAALAFRRGAHMGMTILTARLPDRVRRGVVVFSLLLVLAFLVVLVYWGIRHAVDVRSQRSPVVFNISMMGPYLAIPVGGLLMIVQNLRHLSSGRVIVEDDSGELTVSM